MENKTSTEKQLGHFTLPEGTIEHDLSIQDRYQNFSAELLRLALLGISAIGLIAFEFIPNTENKNDPLTSEAISAFYFSLICFGISILTALLHRYASVDSLSYHIQSLRRGIRNIPGDHEKAEKERKRRFMLFKISRTAIFISALSLGIAGCSLAWGIYQILKIF